MLEISALDISSPAVCDRALRQVEAIIANFSPYAIEFLHFRGKQQDSTLSLLFPEKKSRVAFSLGFRTDVKSSSCSSIRRSALGLVVAYCCDQNY